MKKNILIADEMHLSIHTMLIEIGMTYDYIPEITRAELLEKLKDYDGLIIRSKTKVDIEMLDNAPELKFIGRAGAGLDLIDIAEAERRGIVIFAANEGNRDAVGEHVIGMLLCLFNHINTADIEVRHKIWKREANRGIELMGMTVGIIGYGNMGSSVAKRLSGFGVKVLAYDKYKSNFGDQYAQEATLEELFEQVDVLSLHVPLTSETKMMVNTDFINAFKKPFFLVNTARGEVASVCNIVEALNSGKLRGACLDVLENEKMSQLSAEQESYYEALFQKKNVILTPHIGGWTHESYLKINEVLIDKIRKIHSQL